MNKRKIITWKSPLINENFEKPTHSITAININNRSDMIEVVIQKGLEMDSTRFTMEHAREIGFINLDKLEKYCK